MRVIYNSSLYKYFNKHFIDNRVINEYIITPNSITGTTRKAFRKRCKYSSHASVLTTRLYWMSRIAVYYMRSFEAEELYIINDVLLRITVGHLYSEIPYSKKLYNKIRKVVHNAIKGKYSANPVRLPSDRRTRRTRRAIRYTRRDVENALWEFTHPRENMMIPYSIYTDTVSGPTDGLVSNITNE